MYFLEEILKSKSDQARAECDDATILQSCMIWVTDKFVMDKTIPCHWDRQGSGPGFGEAEKEKVDQGVGRSRSQSEDAKTALFYSDPTTRFSRSFSDNFA